MVQFDVYRNPVEPGYLVDCQSDYLEVTATRFAVPLVPQAIAPKQMGALNPIFQIDGEPHILTTQFASAVRLKPLGKSIGSLAEHRYEILRAIDILLGGV